MYEFCDSVFLGVFLVALLLLFEGGSFVLLIDIVDSMVVFIEASGASVGVVPDRVFRFEEVFVLE